MNPVTHIEWRFGGWLRDWPAPQAAGLLVLAAAMLFAIAALSVGIVC